MYLFICKYTSVYIYPMIFLVALHVVSKGMKILHNPEDDSLRQQCVSEGLAFTTSEGGESNVRLGIDVRKKPHRPVKHCEKAEAKQHALFRSFTAAATNGATEKKKHGIQAFAGEGRWASRLSVSPPYSTTPPQAPEAGIQLFFVNF